MKRTMARPQAKTTEYGSQPDFGPIRPIRNDKDYSCAMVKLEHLQLAGPILSNAEREIMEVLSVLTKDYRDRWMSQTISDSISAIRFVMHQRGLTQADLSTLLGSRSRASEILRGRRSLTLDQIRRLNQAWAIPAELLIKESIPAEAAEAG